MHVQTSNSSANFVVNTAPPGSANSRIRECRRIDDAVYCISSLTHSSHRAISIAKSSWKITDDCQPQQHLSVASNDTCHSTELCAADAA